VFVSAHFRRSATDIDINNAIHSIEVAEDATKRLQGDSGMLALLGGSEAALRERREVVRRALIFAEAVARLDLPTEFIDYLFRVPANILVIRAEADELLGSCSAMRTEANPFKQLAQLDLKLWCGAELLDRAPLDALLDRNKRALQYVEALRDYVSFLHA